MNIRFFGDRFDFMKWDLLTELATKLPGERQLTYLPMLTACDGQAARMHVGEYSRGERRPEVFRFLQSVGTPEGPSTFVDLGCLMKELGVRYAPSMADRCAWLDATGRRGYLRGVPKASLADAVVFADPDNGITQGRGTGQDGDRHITLADVSHLWHRLPEASVLVIYHHLSRRSRPGFYADTLDLLWYLLGLEGVCVVSDGIVAFFVCARTEVVARECEEVLQDYVEGVDGLGLHTLASLARDAEAGESGPAAPPTALRPDQPRP